MKKMLILLLLFCAIAVTVGSSDAVSDPSENQTLSGDIVLTEDMVFEDGSVINIADGTTIDVSSYTLSFGDDSIVTIMGDLALKCTTGGFTMGVGTSLAIADVTLPSPIEEMSLCFDGTLTMDVTPSMNYKADVSFTPNGDDHNVYVTWGYSTISIEDPAVEIEKSLIGSHILIGFESLHFRNYRYDGDTLICTSDVQAGEGSLGLSIAPIGVFITSMDMPAITITKSYALSGITTTVSISGIGPVIIETDENMIQTIDTKIETVTFERDKNDKMLSMVTAEDLDLKTVIDLNMLSHIFDHDDDYDPSDIIRTLELDAESVQVQKESGDIVHIHNLCIMIHTVNPSEYLTVDMIIDDCSYSIAVSRPEFSSFTLSKDLVADLTMKIDTISVTKTEGKEKSTLTLTNTVLETDRLNLLALFDIMSVQGTITVQDVLDNCDLVHVSVDTTTITSSKLNAKVDGLEALLTRDGRKINTLTIWFDGAVLDSKTDDGTLSSQFDTTRIVLESDSSMNETIDAIFSESHFTSDSNSMLTIYNAGFVITYTHDNSELKVMMLKSSESSPENISLSMSMVHYMYSDVTTIATELSAMGHKLTLTYKERSNGTEDDVSITFSAADITNTMTISFGEDITFDSNLRFLWSIDFYYHNIQFQADADVTSLEISRGSLDVEGYDRTEGIIPTFKRISTNNFTGDMRISSYIDGIVFYNNDRKTVLNDYSDIEMDIRHMNLDMKRNDTLTIVIDGVRLFMLSSDGSVFDRELPHLEIVKDLSDKPPEKNLLEEMSPYLLGAFIGASIILALLLIYLRVKVPDLFKFTE